MNFIKKLTTIHWIIITLVALMLLGAIVPDIKDKPENKNNISNKVEKVDIEKKDKYQKLAKKMNKYERVQLIELAKELYKKYENEKEVDRLKFEKHIIQGEGIVTNMNSRGTKFYIHFNSEKDIILEEENAFNNPWKVKVTGYEGNTLKNGDKVKFSGAVGRLGGDYNSPGGNTSWSIYIEDWNKKYTYINKIY